MFEFGARNCRRPGATAADPRPRRVRSEHYTRRHGNSRARSAFLPCVPKRTPQSNGKHGRNFHQVPHVPTTDIDNCTVQVVFLRSQFAVSSRRRTALKKKPKSRHVRRRVSVSVSRTFRSQCCDSHRDSADAAMPSAARVNVLASRAGQDPCG